MKSRNAPMAKRVYQIKVALNDVSPAVWRRIQIDDDASFRNLHETLQFVMGWTDTHLHQFSVDGKYYGVPDPEDEVEMIDESRMKVSQVIPEEGAKFLYEYDFGDGWEHELLVEKILPAEKGVKYPVCLEGKRACPPEDCGGPFGYEELLDIVRNPEHPEYEERRTWLGEEFDPERFDLEETNSALRQVKRTRTGTTLTARKRS